jgi:Domain of unknown function (DUF7014)/AbiJ N-terminal domain 4
MGKSPRVHAITRRNGNNGGLTETRRMKAMEDYEPFSTRQRNLSQSDQPRIYQYDDLPTPFRTQVIHIWRTAIGFYQVPPVYGNMPRESDPVPMNKFWDSVIDTLSREYGVLDLGRRERNSQRLCEAHLLESDTEKALDIIELTFRLIDSALRKLSDWERQRHRIRQSPDSAIQELNKRFRQHAIGYRFESGQVIKMSSDYLHEQVTLPAIRLLNTEGFAGASREFMVAHDHYRHGRYDVAIGEASNSLESTIKTIFDKQGITYRERSTANQLIRKFFETGLVPEYLRSSFENLINTLQGLPTVRSKESAHGEGLAPKQVPPFFAEYALNAAATAILFFVAAHVSRSGD